MPHSWSCRDTPALWSPGFCWFSWSRSGAGEGATRSPNPSYLRMRRRASGWIPPIRRPHSGVCEDAPLPQISHSWPSPGFPDEPTKPPVRLPAPRRAFPNSFIVASVHTRSDAWPAARISHNWTLSGFHTKGVAARLVPKNLIIAPESLILFPKFFIVGRVVSPHTSPESPNPSQ
jgi:hypothetical protein